MFHAHCNQFGLPACLTKQRLSPGAFPGPKTPVAASTVALVETASVEQGQELTSTVTSVTDCEVDMAQETTIQEHPTSESKTPAQRFSFFVFLLCTFLTLADWFGLLG